MSDNPRDYASADYKIPFSQPLQWFQDYIRDHWRAEYNFTLITKSVWGNVFDYNQKSFTKHELPQQ